MNLEEFISDEEDLTDDILRTFARKKFREQIDYSDDNSSENTSESDIDEQDKPIISKKVIPQSQTEKVSFGGGTVLEVDVEDLEKVNLPSRPLGTSGYYGGDEGAETEDQELELLECIRLHRLMCNSALRSSNFVMNDFLSTTYEHCSSLLINMNALLPVAGRQTTETSKIVSTKELISCRDHLVSHGYRLYELPSFVEEDSKQYRQYLRSNYPEIYHFEKLSETIEKELSLVWRPLFKHYVESNRLRQDSIATMTIVQAKQQSEELHDLCERWIEKRKQGVSLLDKSGLTENITLKENQRKQSRPAQQAFLELVGMVLLAYIKKPQTSFKKMALKSPGPEHFLQCLESVDDEDDEAGNVTVVGEESESAFDTEENLHRPITKEIFENKGLPTKSARRSKKERNPRVNLRRRHKKALIKKRSMIPDTRRELHLYQGETRGIRAGLVKSVKF